MRRLPLKRKFVTYSSQDEGNTPHSYRGKYLGWSGGRMRLGRSMSSPEPLLGFSGEEMGEAGSVQ